MIEFFLKKAAIVQKHSAGNKYAGKNRERKDCRAAETIYLNCCVVAIKSPAIVVSFVFGNYNNVSKLMQ